MPGAHLQFGARGHARCQTGKHRMPGQHREELQMSALQVNLDLIRKYNVPGPRYTSYPPATQFTDQLSFDTLTEKIRANNETQGDLSLYFHLPFCQSLCWYCGCTTVITTQQGQSAIYIKYL